jgi:hypothetical protein
MRMLTPQSTAAPPASEVRDAADTQSILAGRALARQMTLLTPQGTLTPQSTAAPPIFTDTQSIFASRAVRETPPAGVTRAAPYMIAMAPLRALASLFSNLLGVGAVKEEPREIPLGTRYEVQLRSGPPTSDTPYHCRLPPTALPPTALPPTAQEPTPEPAPAPAPAPGSNPYLVDFATKLQPRIERESFWV